MTDFDETTLQLQTGALDCPECGGRMVFDPSEQKLRCPYCGVLKSITYDRMLRNEYDIRYTLPESDRAWNDNVRAVRCRECGAEFVLTGESDVAECPLCCGRSIDTEGVVPSIAPEDLVPFSVTLSQARDLLERRFRWRLFSPSALRKAAGEGRLQGLYLAEWCFGADALSDYSAVILSEAGQEDGADPGKKAEAALRWKQLRGSLHRRFDDIHVASNLKMGLESVLPYSQKRIVPYCPERIAGFPCKKPGIAASAAWKQAREELDSRMEDLSLKDAEQNGKKTRMLSVSARYENVLVRTTLLPVYMCSCRSGKKLWRTVINGQTGKIGGPRPLSVLKVAVFVLIVLLLLFGAYELYLHTGNREYLFMQY